MLKILHMHKLPFLVLLSVVCSFLSCSDTANNNSAVVKIDTGTLKPANPIIETKAVNTVADSGLQQFCNMEIVPYCVLLPLQEYTEDFKDETVVKAQHKFVLKANPKAFAAIDVQGFTIDKANNFNTQLFYKRDKADLEESGLAIDSSYADNAAHFYFIKGYLPNFMNKKFVQLSWVYEDRIAINITYLENDELVWKQRITAMIKQGIAYSNK